ncbi:hypothetical protein, partial [Methylosinus sp. R-45379]|uniref:hypothetical protein n=1 Tax=Methylosinus sp. R-45379 TaxID=980563 RepID=UPI001AECA57F
VYYSGYLKKIVISAINNYSIAIYRREAILFYRWSSFDATRFMEVFTEIEARPGIVLGRLE